MPLPQPVRIAALAAAGMFCAGCGEAGSLLSASGPAHAVSVARDMPRAMPPPSEAKPLPLESEPTSLAAQQASATSLTLAPRIVELATTPRVGSGGTIRQPDAVSPAPATEPQPSLVVREPRPGVVNEPPAPALPAAPPAVATSEPPPAPATESLRSAFAPPTVPPSAPPPVPAPMPQLPAVPNFDVAAPTPSPGVQSGPYAIATSPTAANTYQPPQPPPQQTAAFPAAPPAFGTPAFAPPVAAPRNDGMLAVAQQAQAISNRGLAMAQRGMLFAGKSEMTKALQLIAQALDVQEGGNIHATALSSGLVALEEARDFSPTDRQPGAVVEVAAVAQTHRTPLLKTAAAGEVLSPVVAQQQYFGLAQSQLVVAAGGQPVASQVLYRLGRLQSALAAHDAAPQALHGPQAMVFHQAALAIDGNNYLAANELGVLLARYGQLESARQLLVRSVTVRPQVESWHNLAVVHRRLGETELAKKADRERELLAQKTGGRSTATDDLVQWVDPRTFAASGGGDVHWPENTAAKTPAATAGQRR